MTAMIGEHGAIKSAPPRRLGHGAMLALVIFASMVCLVLLTLPDMVKWRFGDADDMMRLQEVRDWLAGQSWFDLTQYRIAPPGGLSMHWSRLLDVPLAAVILMVRPFAGEHLAELSASILVPLITFALIAMTVAAITRRMLASDQPALLAAFFTVANIGTISVARPMRIDHHGWQALCALVMVLALIGDRNRRRAAVAGVFAAFWMHVSLEGIVFTAGCGAWLGLSWIAGRERCRDALPVFLAAAAAASLGFFVSVHGFALFARTFCDAVSPVHIVVLALAAAGSSLAVRLAPDGMIGRGLTLGAVALVAAATYRLWAPQCSGGAFSSLTPLTYRLWYLTVDEGLPLWTQPATLALGWVAFPLVGLIGAAHGLRSASPDRRPLMIDYLAMLVIATLIGIVVMRASAMANLLAIPGSLIIFAPLWKRAQAISSMLARIAVSAAVTILAVPLTPACLVLAAVPYKPTNKPAQEQRIESCLAASNMVHFDALPKSVIMTTLDTSQALIFMSHQSAVGAGYHRNVASMTDVIRFFTADDATAHDIMRVRHARYAFVCPGDGDALTYTKASPAGLASRLEEGEPPLWLKPVQTPGLRYAKVYKLID